jgi:hypothetical protein
MISLVCQKSPGGTINFAEKDANNLIEDSKFTPTTESLSSKKFKSTDYRVKPRPNVSQPLFINHSVLMFYQLY